MHVIDFEKPKTWLELVEAALQSPFEYHQRLAHGNLNYAHSDCSGLSKVFSESELRSILRRIEQLLPGYAVRLYHGCRFNHAENPRNFGLKASSTSGIVATLLDLAERDPILSEHIADIKTTVTKGFFREQSRCRTGQIHFCLTYHEMIEDGGVYIAFGSEYRLVILNDISNRLKFRLFYYGIPAVIAVELPIEDFLMRYKDNVAKFLFSLWIHHCLEFDNDDKPIGFACHLDVDIPPEHVKNVIHPSKVHDQFNRDGRWYLWDEIHLCDET